jgi:hypothetical protein
VDLQKIVQAAEPFGFELRQTAGVDMLVEKEAPSARRAVHLVLTGEKVRDEYAEATPETGPGPVIRGLRLIALRDLVRMKLISFRPKDDAHLKDLDEAGLVTPDIEEGLSPVLRERLARVRDAGVSDRAVTPPLQSPCSKETRPAS